MAFDWKRGLANAGQSIAQTVGVIAIEEQRSALARETMQLADQLAGERESRGRKEAHGYAMEQQGTLLAHQSGEKEKDRSHQEKMTDKEIAARITTAGISASASIRSAEISANALPGEAKMIRYLADPARTPEEKEIGQKLIDKTKPAEVQTAEWFAAATRAQQEAFKTTSHVALAVRNAQKFVPLEGGRMAIVDADGIANEVMGPDGKPFTGFVDKERQAAITSSLSGYNKQVDDLNRQFQTEMREAQARQKDAAGTTAQREVRAYIEQIKKEHESRIQPLVAMQNRLLEELMGGKVRPAPTTSTRPPLSSFDPAQPLLGGPM